MKLEGYFENIKAANDTTAKLNKQGFKGAFVDLNEHNNNAYSQIGIVGSEEISSLSEAVLGEGGIRGDDVNSPLAAASPMVSGMGGFEEIADVNCKVVVEVNNENEKDAVNIIKSMGGTTEDPNARIPKELHNINEDALILANLKD